MRSRPPPGPSVGPRALCHAARKKTTDWTNINWDSLEDEWKDGDSEEELTTDDQLLYKEMEMRRERGPQVNQRVHALV